MPGRGDNNKSGSAGRGASNQSNQPFIADEHKEPASNHSKEPTGGTRSADQRPQRDPDANRGVGESEKQLKALRSDKRTFHLMVDDVPYVVATEPFTFNDELRFKVKVNEGTEHVFTWDSELGRLRAIDDSSSTMPDALETAISERLQSREK